MRQPVSERPATSDVPYLPDTAEQRKPFQNYGKNEHQLSDPDLGERLRMLELVETLIYRKQPAETKKEHSDDKAPEVAQLAVSEWMLVIGRPGRLAQPKEEQHLIAGIGIGVNGLCDHAARSGQPGGPCLGNCDAGIGEKGIENRPRR